MDEGSFSRAAGRLGLPKSTVSRRVSALEAQLGERLLLRTTRKLSVTDFGLAVLEHAHHVVEDVAAATSLAQNRQVEPAGRLRVTMPSEMATRSSSHRCSRSSCGPIRRSRWRSTSRRASSISSARTSTSRSAWANLRDDASLAARRIAEFAGSLYAAPAYIARHGTPSEPEALMEHDTLRILSRTGDPMPWILSRGEQRWEGIRPAAPPPTRRIS